MVSLFLEDSAWMLCSKGQDRGESYVSIQTSGSRCVYMHCQLCTAETDRSESSSRLVDLVPFESQRRPAIKLDWTFFDVTDTGSVRAFERLKFLLKQHNMLGVKRSGKRTKCRSVALMVVHPDLHLCSARSLSVSLCVCVNE
jgi:hypothetical protein